MVEAALQQVLGGAVSLRCVTIGTAATGGGSTASPPRETFKTSVERDLRAVHMERKTF